MHVDICTRKSDGNRIRKYEKHASPIVKVLVLRGLYKTAMRNGLFVPVGNRTQILIISHLQTLLFLARH